LISPDIKDLMRNMDSRYTLVVATAKRARQLTDGAEPLTRFRSDKPVTLAIHEIAEGKVDYFREAAKQPEYGADKGHHKASGAGYRLYGGITGDYDDDDAHTTYNVYDDLSEGGGAYAGHENGVPAGDQADADYDMADDETRGRGRDHSHGHDGGHGRGQEYSDWAE
jgi:DNA-directed RNA polymerase subunit omega